MSIDSTFAQRLEKIMAHLEVNQSGFASRLGYDSPEKISRLLRKSKNDKPAMPSFEIVADISNKFDWLNCGWLLTGKGEMILPTHNKDGIANEERADYYNKRINNESYVKQSGSISIKNDFSKKYDKKIEEQLVKLYNMEAVAGLIPTIHEKAEVLDYMTLPGLPKCDGAFVARGDSMTPVIEKGDILLFSIIHHIDELIWGQIYLVSFTRGSSEYNLIKYIDRGDDKKYIRLRSNNPNYHPTDVAWENIRAIAAIRATVRLNEL